MPRLRRLPILVVGTIIVVAALSTGLSFLFFLVYLGLLVIGGSYLAARLGALAAVDWGVLAIDWDAAALAQGEVRLLLTVTEPHLALPPLLDRVSARGFAHRCVEKQFLSRRRPPARRSPAASQGPQANEVAVRSQ